MSRRVRLYAFGVDALAAAVGFLTAVPVPEWRATRGRPFATIWFGWVGAGLAAAAALTMALPVRREVAATLAVALLAVLTGGLHWDGWADTLDAVWTPGFGRVRRVEILRDPRVGAHGALGVALLVLLRVLALASAPAWGVLVGSALGRWVMVATLRWAPTLRPEGSAARLAAEARPGLAACALAPILGLTLWLGSGLVGLASVVAAALALASLASAFLVARLGGMNGDGHGAVGLLAESVVWLVAAEVACA